LHGWKHKLARLSFLWRLCFFLFYLS
jgi:hypothetical protein